MKVAAIYLAKDEEDIIYHSILNMAEEGIDTIIVANNMSTDNTESEILKVKDLLKDSPCEVVLVQDNEVGYYQSKKTTDLARLAHEQYEADWIISSDSDELWYADDTIKNFLSGLDPKINCVTADLYNHFGSGIDPHGAIPFQNIGWRQSKKGALPKVAFKWQDDAVIGQGNHSVEMKGIKSVGGLEIRHFPYRSWEHFKRKALNGYAAYKATDLPESMGGHWRSYGQLIEAHGDDKIRKEVFEKYFWFLSPTDNGMIFDPAPFRRWNK